MHYTLRSNGDPVSVEQMLELWRAGMTDLIEPHAGDLGARQIIVDGDPAAGTLRRHALLRRIELPTLCGLSGFSAISAPLFENHGYTADLAGMLRLLGTTELLTRLWGSMKHSASVMRFSRRLSQNGDDDVRIADLPVPPAVGQIANYCGRQRKRSARRWCSMTVRGRTQDQSVRAPVAALLRGRRRVRRTSPARMANLRPHGADQGSGYGRRVTATNEYGAGDPATTALSAVVVVEVHATGRELIPPHRCGVETDRLAPTVWPSCPFAGSAVPSVSG